MFVIDIVITFVVSKYNKYMENSFLKLSSSIIERNIDSETGEILNENIVHNKFIANSKEEFFLCYVKLLSVIKDISGPAIKIYAYLLNNHKPGNLIGINGAMKQEIKEFIGSKGKTMSIVDNSLSELTKVNLLFRKPDVKGGYYINPRYAFKGSTHDRNNSLKAIIELGCEDC